MLDDKKQSLIRELKENLTNLIACLTKNAIFKIAKNKAKIQTINYDSLTNFQEKNRQDNSIELYAEIVTSMVDQIQKAIHTLWNENNGIRILLKEPNNESSKQGFSIILDEVYLEALVKAFNQNSLMKEYFPEELKDFETKTNIQAQINKLQNSPQHNNVANSLSFAVETTTEINKQLSIEVKISKDKEVKILKSLLTKELNEIAKLNQAKSDDNSAFYNLIIEDENSISVQNAFLEFANTISTTLNKFNTIISNIEKLTQQIKESICDDVEVNYPSNTDKLYVVTLTCPPGDLRDQLAAFFGEDFNDHDNKLSFTFHADKFEKEMERIRNCRAHDIIKINNKVAEIKVETGGYLNLDVTPTYPKKALKIQLNGTEHHPQVKYLFNKFFGSKLNTSTSGVRSINFNKTGQLLSSIDYLHSTINKFQEMKKGLESLKKLWVKFDPYRREDSSKKGYVERVINFSKHQYNYHFASGPTSAKVSSESGIANSIIEALKNNSNKHIDDELLDKLKSSLEERLEGKIKRKVVNPDNPLREAYLAEKEISKKLVKCIDEIKDIYENAKNNEQNLSFKTSIWSTNNSSGSDLGYPIVEDSQNRPSSSY